MIYIKKQAVKILSSPPQIGSGEDSGDIVQAWNIIFLFRIIQLSSVKSKKYLIESYFIYRIEKN